MSSIKSCAVFCGSRAGNLPLYLQEARSLGSELAKAHINLIYGGGHIGLMGEVADATLKAGGHVKGIIPQFLSDKEVLHEGVTDLDVTEDMPSRKAKLFDLSDAYVILPGGFGTLDEFYEVLVNRQLGLHNKPIIILNIGNWAHPLIQLLEASVAQGFANPESYKLYDIAETVPALIEKLTSHS